ncbi:hypothetical protein [Corallococcus macrosporus]|uniref:Outer membrane protein beta-barrel domain-containing protein n=1 Tax=Myxococcus fulvus (strain ATCC BAA-855 / HW-1) TaxID=483219 RepID=F8CHN5_MYXFH|nr:hypothetical protein [Corallococcus macrosporus]AEI67536.1 hypothetical protein LILAB_28245 [Corallococcus macrosporus]
MLRRLLPLALLLSAPAAAQDHDGYGDEDVSTSLDGVGRITIQGGWRITPNKTLYDGWYARQANQGLPRAREVTGGPTVTASFAYAISDLLEVGIDLFGTKSRLYLNEPGADGAPPQARQVDTLGYGALIGLRFQTVLPGIGPHGLVPFAGLLTGPTLASSERKGEALQEITTQAWMGNVGATLRLTPRWGITADYRLAFLRGPVGPSTGRVGSFSLGGSWLSLGVTYSFPAEPSRPLSGGL